MRSRAARFSIDSSKGVTAALFERAGACCGRFAPRGTDWWKPRKPGRQGGGANLRLLPCLSIGLVIRAAPFTFQG